MMAVVVAVAPLSAAHTRPEPPHIVDFAGAEWQLAAHNATP
ncbi:hypothetical protein predicted by Glimmer/Critica [Acetobacter ghanensis]|uniref:Uncharacterized protein n=1 Tax=Acetobacter ghanensis TaxID=431306 RepID=A0A0U5F241_9PROT|nr:hypothetical protein predicted by Glimmer/Critica [Acetobacter ghanensis]